MIKKTFLPVFQGFYGTFWDGDSQSEMMIQNLREDGATEKEIDFVFNSEAYSRAWKEYQQTVCADACNAVEKKLQELGLIESLKFEKLVSPREYNFQNDSINVEIAVIENAIVEYLQDHIGAFDTYLKDHYTSRDGFISSHSTDTLDWLAGNGFMDNEHELGAVLEFILEAEGYDAEALYNDTQFYGGAYFDVPLDDIRKEMQA